MQKILILDFGGQYNQLIARRVRENHVYCEVHPHSLSREEILHFDPIGVIFTGGPRSVYDADAPRVDPVVFSLGVPILGICYGCQLLAQTLGGEVVPAQDASAREYGKTLTRFDRSETDPRETELRRAQEVVEALAARFPDDPTIKASAQAIRKARERRAAHPWRPRRPRGP